MAAPPLMAVAQMVRSELKPEDEIL